MRNNQDASAGANSTVNQAGRDITVNNVQSDMTYERVRTISLDVFKANFYDLGEDVRQIANKRAEEITNQFIEKLLSENPHLLENTSDPDIRYDLFDIQKAYARFGDTEMAELLIDVLVQRTKAEDSFSSIVLNEALTVIPKLTKFQINILSVLYVIESVRYINPGHKTISSFYDAFLSPFIDDRLLPKNHQFYLHLQSCGCLAVTLMANLKLVDIFQKKFDDRYPDLELIMQEIREDDKLDAFEKSWSGDALLKRCALSSVGLAIGLANFNLTTGNNFNLERHIYE